MNLPATPASELSTGKVVEVGKASVTPDIDFHSSAIHQLELGSRERHGSFRSTMRF